MTDPVHTMLWAAWSELGVPGGRETAAEAADPEPLIAFTPHLAADEPRLLGLVFDWCLAHQAWISATRLAGCVAAASPEVQVAAGRFNAALWEHGVRWNPRTNPP